MDDSKHGGISRRDFARHAALASAASLVFNSVLESAAAPRVRAQQPPEPPKLSPEGQTEVDSRVQAILSQYGGRFSDEQKSELRRLCTAAQPSLDRMRAFAVENGDGTALYLKPLMEHERKSSAPAAAKSSAALHQR